MKYPVHKTKRFRQDLRRAKKRCKDLRKLYHLLHVIQQGIPLSAHYRNHRLWQSKYNNAFEFHVYPDFLIIYRFQHNVLHFLRCGSHADLF
ncbi:MAG: type II toxin-antitoxin system YafQ family toxin [Iphinoe sp. HA4291-MV1]|nr:type II toxin-antitoxin system YafQ family toxin [Iphinoe sp. HA4291-MV1]